MITLLHGDCLDLMPSIPDGSVDLVVTDPPFRVKIGTQTKRTPAYDKLKDAGWGLEVDWIKEAYRVMKVGAQIYVCTSDHDMSFHREALEAYGFSILGKLVWIETNPLPSYTKKCYRGGLNLALHARKGDTTTYFAKRTQQELRPYWFFPKVGGKKRTPHPTQKPLELIQEWVLNSSQEGDTVLDPYMGSGTTGVACVNTGRNFIGIEQDAGYFEIAQRRIQEAQNKARQLTLLEVAS